MRKRTMRYVCEGVLLLGLFGLWTWLVQVVDVKTIGASGTQVGFAAFNGWFHQLTGVHMWIYALTDWLGLVPLGVCLGFGVLGAVQLARGKRLLGVDADLLWLGGYYILVILCYLVFEMLPINYRPILIEGRMEASYPSSTTLLVLSVMPTLVLQIQRRVAKKTLKKAIIVLTMIFSVSMVTGRLLSGVHWVTDIVGSVLLSVGLVCLYRAVICDDPKKKGERNGIS